MLVLALFAACFGLDVAGVVKFGEQKPVCVFVMRPLAPARLIIPLSGGSNQCLLFKMIIIIIATGFSSKSGSEMWSVAPSASIQKCSFAR